MPNEIEIFDAACAAGGLGGLGFRFHPIPHDISEPFEAMRRAAQMIIRDASASPEYTDLIPIYFDFVDSGWVNGAADIHDGMGLIGACRGAVLMVQDMFAKVLSHPHAVPFVEGAEKETVHSHHTKEVGTSWDQLVSGRRRSHRPTETIFPIHPNRKAYAKFLTAVAQEFLILHELAHITHGHMEYLYGRARNELNYPPPLTMQAIEMDADCYAATTGLNKLFYHRRNSQTLAPEWRPFVSTDEQAIFAWQFAILSLFILLGLGEGSKDFGQHHPPLTMRCLIVGAAALELLDKRQPGLVPNFIVYSGLAVEQAARAAVLIEKWVSQPDGTALMREFQSHADEQSDHRKHSRLIAAEWTRIRPEILKYSYTPNLAP